MKWKKGIYDKLTECKHKMQTEDETKAAENAISGRSQ